MGDCNCGGKKAGVKWEAKLGDGSTQTYESAGEARNAIKGQPGATFRAVSK